MELKGIEPLVDMIALTLQSAFLKGEKTPLSLMLVSEPESAKTTTLHSFANLDFVAYYDEITAKQLIDLVIPQVKNGRCKYLVIPDLINCIDKNRSSRDQLLAVLKSATDDTGIKRIATAYKSIEVQKNEDGIRFGIITAITTRNFKTIRHYIAKTGFLSRFIPFTYSYPIDKVMDIMQMIAKRQYNGIPEVPKINAVLTEVKSNAALNEKLFVLAREIGKEYEGYGIRAQVNLQRLAASNALLHKRKAVTNADIEKVMTLSRWMNYRFNQI